MAATKKKAPTPEPPVLDLVSFTVVDAIEIPHCEEGQHEHFAPCASCDPELVPGARGGMVPQKDGSFILCPVCGGTREGGPSLGMFPCDVPPTRYSPGQTVFMTQAKADSIDGGALAAPGADIELLQLHAALRRRGLKVAE